MKKILLILLIIFPLRVFSISASSAIAMDLDTGRVLYGYNINESKLIASITKIMTAIVTIETTDINREVKVTDVIKQAYGSAIYIKVGEQITIKDLLYGLMLRSGNDAALVIACATAGSEEEFVYLMNEYATNLKMNHTKFYNPHGLEEDNGDANKSSALDMAKLTKYAMQNKTFREIFSTKSHTVKTNYNTYVWHNKNKLLSLDYITGGKTGFTELARRTLVTTGSKNNIDIVVVTLNDPNDWSDHKKIYEEIFKKYNNYTVIDKKKFNVKDDKYYKNAKLYVKKDYQLSLKKEELKKVSLNINLIKQKNYLQDANVGFIEVMVDGVVFHKEPVYVQKKDEKPKLNWWQKFRGWIFKW